ncbi:MAG: TatD family hydrolase [Spirochaetales bacterium]
MHLFDSHAHIGLITEDPIEQIILIQEARKEGVEALVSICNNLLDFFQVYENLKTANQVYFSIGVAPSEVANLPKDWVQKIETGARLPRVIALGEIGLDYYRKFGNKDSQIELFIRQLEIAERLGLPVIIHNREAGRDVLEILKEKLPPRGGVLHCYSEDWNYAKEALELNLYISFAGNVTYRNARNLHETAKRMPLDRMLLESESPFMVPAIHRGKRNKPAYLKYTAEFIAELRNEDLSYVTEIIFQNSLRFFQLTI